MGSSIENSWKDASWEVSDHRFLLSLVMKIVIFSSPRLSLLRHRTFSPYVEKLEGRGSELDEEGKEIGRVVAGLAFHG